MPVNGPPRNYSPNFAPALLPVVDVSALVDVAVPEVRHRVARQILPRAAIPPSGVVVALLRVRREVLQQARSVRLATSGNTHCSKVQCAWAYPMVLIPKNLTAWNITLVCHGNWNSIFLGIKVCTIIDVPSVSLVEALVDEDEVCQGSELKARVRSYKASTSRL